MNSDVESLAAEFAENLLKPEDFLVEGGQYAFQAAIWGAQEACLAGDEEGIFLWVVAGAGRRTGLQAVSERAGQAQNGRVQVTSPEILEQHMAADQATFVQMMRRCRRILVWIEPRDFLDCSLVYWWSVWKELNRGCAVPVMYLCPWKLDDSKLQYFKNIHKDIRIIESKCGEYDHINVEFADAGEDVLDLSDDFWKGIYKKKVFVVCRQDENRIKYAEASHRAHVPVCFADKMTNRGHGDGFQYIDRYAALCLSDELTFNKVVWIDPDVPLHDGMPVLAGWMLKKSDIHVVATSRSSVLYTIAGFDKIDDDLDGVVDDIYIDTCCLYASLIRSRRLEKCTADEYIEKHGMSVLNHWIRNGWMDSAYQLTYAGQALFPEVQHFSQLGILHGFHHETVAETAGHEFRFDIDTQFFRNIVSMRFVLGSHVWQRKYHHILKSHAILMPDTSHHGNGWLDRLPVWISPAYMLRIQNYIKGAVIPERIRLVGKAEEAICIIRSEFQDTPERWIEVFNDEAKWWTFGGGEWNRMIADMLHILAPKLEISYGNFNLLLRWHGSGQDVQAVILRLKSLAKQISCMVIDYTESKFSAFYDIWKRNHLYYWMFRLLPDDCIKNEFERVWMQFIGWFNDKPLTVAETDKFHQVDDMPMVFEPLCRIEKISGNHIENEWAADKYCVRRSVQQTLYRQTSDNHKTPVVQGVMHTRLPWRYIDNDMDLQRAIDVILKQKYIGLDVETTLFDQTLCLIQIGCIDQSFIIDPLCVDILGLSQVFSHPNIIKIIHNASFECKVLGNCGMQIHNIVDTMKVSRKLYGMKAPGGHSLKAVCRREFGLDMDKTNQTSRWEKRPLSDSQLEYAALDAEILIHLYRKFFEHA